MLRIAIALTVLATAAAISGSPAKAHEWHPKECCNNDDCAPVESFKRLVPTASVFPQFVVTSRYRTAVVPHDFPLRVSKDGRMHVCMRQNEFGTGDVMCLFMPPRYSSREGLNAAASGFDDRLRTASCNWPSLSKHRAIEP